MAEGPVISHKVLVEGRSRRLVAREMGVSRNTVRRYMVRSEPRRTESKPWGRPAYDQARDEKALLEATSPFAFSAVSERTILRFLSSSPATTARSAPMPSWLRRISWTGYHVHEQIISGWSTINYPMHFECNLPSITSGCPSGPNWHMGYVTWTESYP